MSRRRLLLNHAISIEYIAWLRHRLRQKMLQSMDVASIIISFRARMEEGGNSVPQTLIPAGVSECGEKCSGGYIIISINNPRNLTDLYGCTLRGLVQSNRCVFSGTLCPVIEWPEKNGRSPTSYALTSRRTGGRSSPLPTQAPRGILHAAGGRTVARIASQVGILTRKIRERTFRRR